MNYSLVNSYVGESLLSGFNWFDGADPSNGFAAYQTRAAATEKGLWAIDGKSGVVRLGVDNVNTYALDQGRPSIRLESNKTFHHGLFIADFLHMPPSECGLWPAFWSYGEEWPHGGEVDILEGANTAQKNLISAHTTDGCTITPPSTKQAYAGEQLRVSCAVDSQNVGCGYNAAKAASYGDGFNAAGGGVYAMQWDSHDVKVWHFARNEIPADVEAKKPDPTTWKLPEAVFGGSSCNVDSHFKNMKLVINTNFCGDWGNAAWGTTDKCTQHAPTCNEHVAKNPRAFANAYWDVRYIDAYQTPSQTASEVTADEKTRRSSKSLAVRSPAQDGSMTGQIGPFQNLTSDANQFVVVEQSHFSNSSLPAANVSNDAQTTEKHQHMGCFVSNNGFQTFREVMESSVMTIQQCLDLCKGKGALAGLFESRCLCADEIDTETKTVDEVGGGACDRQCSGAHDEICGGLMKQQSSIKVEWSIFGNWTKLLNSSSSTDSGGALKFANSTRPGNAEIRLPIPSGSLSRRSVPRMMLLSVYSLSPGQSAVASNYTSAKAQVSSSIVQPTSTPSPTIDKLKAALISNGPIIASKAAMGVFDDLADLIGGIVSAETIQRPSTRANNQCSCEATKAPSSHSRGHHAHKNLVTQTATDAVPLVTQAAALCNLETKVDASVIEVPTAEAMASTLNATASGDAAPFVPDNNSPAASRTALWNTQHFWTDPPALMSHAPRRRGSARLTAVLGATLLAAAVIMH